MYNLKNWLLLALIFQAFANVRIIFEILQILITFITQKTY